jgi:hypothetical protein
MASFCLSIVACLVFLQICSAATPFGMIWSTDVFGPDGPWQAIQVQIGSPGQKIALYPGGTFETHIFSVSICTNQSLGTSCPANFAGLFDNSTSGTVIQNVILDPASTDLSDGSLNVGGSLAKHIMDQVNIDGDGNIIPNVSLALHSDAYLIYPDGSTYPLSVGTFALGASGGGVNQTFAENPPIPAINASLIPGYLASSEASSSRQTPSNSFGLHIGSVYPAISGSLYFGGYDQNRVIGDISTQQGGGQNNVQGTYDIEMLDIGINVIDGSSPWNTSSISGLLAAGNSSINTVLPVTIQPLGPYLDLPQSTCDAIAAWLPVTYQPKYGLYFWNVNDPQYQKIVTSASALSFTIRKDQSNSMNLTINVPFLLLNLTLESPLISTPTQYFPCNAQSRGSYSLGRAFLQAAFLGTNWDAANGQSLWWLAQAPGPNIAQQPNIQNIGPTDSIITASSNDWKTSWENSWKVLPATTSATSSAPATNTATSTTTAGASSSSGLSAGAETGIGLGAAVVVVAAILAILLFLRRRKASRYAATQSQSPFASGHNLTPYSDNSRSSKYAGAGFGPAEVNGQREPREMEGDLARGKEWGNAHELP